MRYDFENEYKDFTTPLILSNKELKPNPEMSMTVHLIITMILRRLLGKGGVIIHTLKSSSNDVEMAINLIADPRQGYNLGLNCSEGREVEDVIYQCPKCKKTVQEWECENKGDNYYHKKCGKKVKFYYNLKVKEYILRKRSSIW